jgi:hypothetical protein
VHRLLVTANIVSSSPILVTLMMEAIRSSETLVLIRTTRVTSQKMAFFKTNENEIFLRTILKSFLCIPRFELAHSVHFCLALFQ